MLRCWKCKRVREDKYMNLSRRQCKARAVCKNIRNRRRKEKARVQRSEQQLSFPLPVAQESEGRR